MPTKGKIGYCKKEVDTIFYMKEKGYTPREIAERVGRSKHAIENFLHRYRPLGIEKVREMATEEKTMTLSDALDAIPTKIVDVVKEEQKKEAELTNLWNPVDEEVELMPPSIPDGPEDSEPIVVEAEKPSMEIYVVKVKIDDSCPDDDLIRALYNRGYRIEGKLVKQRLVQDEVCLKDILANG